MTQRHKVVSSLFALNRTKVKRLALAAASACRAECVEPAHRGTPTINTAPITDIYPISQAPCPRRPNTTSHANMANRLYRFKKLVTLFFYEM